MKNRFICKVCVAGTELHSKEYTTLKEIAEDLGLSYQQAADISVGRMKKFKEGGFKYQPSIKIQKISL